MNKIIGIIIGKKLGEWQHIDAEGKSIAPGAATFGAHPVYAGVVDEVIDGQCMVRVPAFHYRAARVEAGEHAGKKALWISSEAADGFRLHPAFRSRGAALQGFWIGKYQGTKDGEMLGSQAGKKPLASISFPKMQACAAARGDGWMLWSIYQLAAIQMLALIEMGTPDAQRAIGRGSVSGGGVRAVDDEVVVQAAWRGITGLWGNVWQMVDGLRTDGEGKYRIWDIDGSREYRDTDARPPESGWMRRRYSKSGEGFDLGAVFLPKKTSDERDDSAYGNYFWSYSDAVAYHGGSWSDGADGGLFCLGVYTSASHAGALIGGRLAKV